MLPHEYLERIRHEKPLIHHITNWVTIGECANVTRSFGALPVMAHDEHESADMAGIASALVLNIGTLTPALVQSMILAGKAANGKGIPVILDAVGVGATPLRNDSAALLLREIHFAVIKGNASEIARLAGEDVLTRGVETTAVAADHGDIARAVAMQNESAVAITGAVDVVADANHRFAVRNGHPLMGAVVGTGCMAASAIGAFAAVSDGNFAEAAAVALACYGVAAEIAAEFTAGPGSFKAALFDAIYNLTAEQVKERARIEEA